MNKLILATGSDNNYLGKIQPYLGSIINNSNFDHNVLVFLSDDEIKVKSDKIILTKIPPSKLRAKNINNCIQHGEFIYGDFFDRLNDNDIIFFTDGDIILQRNLTDEELDQFRNFKDGDVYVGYNESPTDTLENESKRIRQLIPTPNELMGDWSKIKIYNTGVLAMNKKTWLRLLEDYISLFPIVEMTFHHYAKQQWLLSFIVGTRDYNIIEMPYHIHNHQHYPSPAGSRIDGNGTVFFNDSVVLFKHKW